jgi:hypothetical protein
MKIKVQKQSAPLAFHDIAHFYQVRAHAAKAPALLLLEGRNPNRAQCLLVSVHIEIVELIEQFGRVTSIGFAFTIEHFGRDHICFHSDLAQMTMKRVAKSARLLHQHDAMLASDEFARQVNDRIATTLAAMNGATARHSDDEHSAQKFDVERHVNHTWFGPKSLKDCRKMGNNVIFEFVVNHTSRMAPSGAVLEAYMTLTAGSRTI